MTSGGFAGSTSLSKDSAAWRRFATSLTGPVSTVARRVLFVHAVTWGSSERSVREDAEEAGPQGREADPHLSARSVIEDPTSEKVSAPNAGL